MNGPVLTSCITVLLCRLLTGCIAKGSPVLLRRCSLGRLTSPVLLHGGSDCVFRFHLGPDKKVWRQLESLGPDKKVWRQLESLGSRLEAWLETKCRSYLAVIGRSGSMVLGNAPYGS